MISNVGSCGKMVVTAVWVHRNENARLEAIDMAQIDGGFPRLDTRSPPARPLWIPAFAGMTGHDGVGLSGAGIPCVRCAPRPLTLCEGDCHPHPSPLPSRERGFLLWMPACAGRASP